MVDPIFKWLSERAKKKEVELMQDPIYALLRKEVERVGRAHEEMPIEKLTLSDEELSFVESVQGTDIYFSCSCVNIMKNGDIQFCIDARATPNKTGFQPSYTFCKSKNGKIYY